jgi:hypothetical protein
MVSLARVGRLHRSRTDAKDQDIALCNRIALERELDLTDPVESKKAPPSAPISELGQVALGGLRYRRFEHADNCMLQSLRKVWRHEGANRKVSHGLHDCCLCHR